jgi:hypothetical protein
MRLGATFIKPDASETEDATLLSKRILRRLKIALSKVSEGVMKPLYLESNFRRFWMTYDFLKLISLLWADKPKVI